MSSLFLQPHLIRYGFAGDQYLLADFVDAFDQLVFNAKIVAHMGPGLSAFMLNNLRGKPYFIDPQTYSFQHDVAYLESQAQPGVISRSFAKLIEAYGPPLTEIAAGGLRAVSPGHFAAEDVLKAFCMRVLEFQRVALTSHATDQDSTKYIRFAERRSGRKIHAFGPAILVPPYFFLDTVSWADWLPINARAIGLAKAEQRASDPPIAAELVLARDLLLEPEVLKEIVAAYEKAKPGAILLWIDGFPEQEANRGQLEALAALASSLSNVAPVANLYGGFFSQLLLRAGVLAAVCHGLEYGEDRAVLPIGGGVASARYYVPCLHTRLLHRVAVRAASEMGAFASRDAFLARVCDCPQCRETIGATPSTDFARYGLRKPGKDGKPYPTAETQDFCATHYLHSKRREFETPVSLESSLEALHATFAELKAHVEAPLVAHLQRWADALRQP
jgi:hypothetical protein